VLYCRFDETAGSTTFTDQTGKQTITAYTSQTLAPAGNALPSPQTSVNGNSAFGNFLGPTVDGGLNSAVISNQQNIGFGITLAPSSSLYLGTNNFTIEMFVYTPNNGTNTLYTDSKNNGFSNRLAGNMAGSGQYWGNSPGSFVIIPPTQGFGFQFNYSGSGPTATNASYSTVAGWHHYAITRNGTNFYVYVDGVVRSNPYSYTGVVDVTNRTWTFGYCWDVSPGTYTNCFIDELRVTIGVDRYNNGATFTVPTSEFPNHG
jgi:hypothetical protein